MNTIHYSITISVSRFAAEKVKPLVSEMDEKEQVNPAIWKGLFDQGFMGIETDSKYGGSNMSFTSAILVVEGRLTFVHF